jgi:hypothetical protein
VTDIAIQRIKRRSLLDADPRLMVLCVLWLCFTIIGGYQFVGLSPDNDNYYQYFTSLNSSVNFSTSRFEPGFQIWTWLAKFIFHMNFDLYVMSIIGFALAVKFALIWRYTSVPIIAAISYIIGFFFLHEYTQLRVALGIAFAFWGAHKHLEGRPAAAAILYFLGMMFHYSVAIVPVIAFVTLSMKRSHVIILISVVALGAILLPSIGSQDVLAFLSQINPLTDRYYYGDNQLEGANIFSIPNIALSLAVIYAVAIRLPARSRYHRFFLYLGIASLVGLIVLNGSLVLALRMKEVLGVAFIFAFTRSRLRPVDVPLVLLMLGAFGYTLARGVGSLSVLGAIFG